VACPSHENSMAPWGVQVARECGATWSGIAIDRVTGRSSTIMDRASPYGKLHYVGCLYVQSGPRKPLADQSARGERGLGTKATHEKWRALNPWGGRTEATGGMPTDGGEKPPRSRLGQGVEGPTLGGGAHGATSSLSQGDRVPWWP